MQFSKLGTISCFQKLRINIQEGKHCFNVNYGDCIAPLVLQIIEVIMLAFEIYMLCQLFR